MDNEQFISQLALYPTSVVIKAERFLSDNGDWSLAKIDPQIETYRRSAIVALCEALVISHSHEHIINQISEAFTAFQPPADEDLPTNAVTLWGSITRGMSRMAKRMAAPSRF